MRKPLKAATGLEVQLENAANACVLATVWFNHTPCRNLVVVTLSEGSGTGILVNCQLARGLSGMAGQFGHVPLDRQGPLCSCGSDGCWEVSASNRAGLRYGQDSTGTAVTFSDLLNQADQGDRASANALDRMAQIPGARPAHGGRQTRLRRDSHRRRHHSFLATVRPGD